MNIPPDRKILLTKEGDTLVIPRGREEQDSLPLAPEDIGWHEQDDGYIGLEQESDTTHVLVCWVCHGLHISIPKTVTTYDQLRAFFQEQLKAPP